MHSQMDTPQAHEAQAPDLTHLLRTMYVSLSCVLSCSLGDPHSQSALLRFKALLPLSLIKEAAARVSQVREAA